MDFYGFTNVNFHKSIRAKKKWENDHDWNYLNKIKNKQNHRTWLFFVYEHCAFFPNQFP